MADDNLIFQNSRCIYIHLAIARIQWFPFTNERIAKFCSPHVLIEVITTNTTVFFITHAYKYWIFKFPCHFNFVYLLDKLFSNENFPTSGIYNHYSSREWKYKGKLWIPFSYPIVIIISSYQHCYYIMNGVILNQKNLWGSKNGFKHPVVICDGHE